MWGTALLMRQSAFRTLGTASLISVFALVCVVTVFQQFNSNFSEIFPLEFVEDKRIPLTDSFRNLKKCVLESDSLWDDLVKKVEKCRRKFFKTFEFLKLKVGRYNEFKVFLPFSKNFFDSQQKCNFITVGIGGDITAEKIFHQFYPKCQIFGLDPKLDQAANFSSIGKFIPYGLSAHGGVMNLTVEIEKLFNLTKFSKKIFTFLC